MFLKIPDVVWSLFMSVEHVKSDFRTCYGGSIEDFPDSVNAADADLSGTDIEERAKCFECSNPMLNLVDDAATTMREKYKHGEPYCQMLYFHCFSTQEYRSQEEILNRFVMECALMMKIKK